MPDVTPYYIAMDSVSAPRGPAVLKEGDAFGIFDDSGQIQAAGPALQGMFFEDTRFVSRLAFTIDGELPVMLSSAISGENTLLEADLANCDLYTEGALRLARDSVHIRNSLLLGCDALFQTIALTSFAASRCSFRLELAISADYIDLFELRGAKRAKRGIFSRVEIGAASMRLGYRGLDDVERETQVVFTPVPDGVTSESARWQIDMAPGERRVLQVEIRCRRGNRPVPAATRAEILAGAQRWRVARSEQVALIQSTDRSFNDWLARSRADLEMLITETPEGLYPYAGIPWFSTAFGRDGLITALQCLWLDPTLAAGVLRFLAARQATDSDPQSEAQPGKILHETRKGEMAALGEIPFGRYYGSVDATPLFVVLADAYQARTGDLALIRSLWRNIAAAIDWIGSYGDVDGDGFVEYGRRSENGLVNQAWKDSGDAIFHRDGRLAEAPIATVEVQAYCYAAYLGGARLAHLMGEVTRADDLERRAAELNRRFDAAFWCEELGTYAIALDRDKKQCRVRSSNAGHVLFGGLATECRAKQVAEIIMAPASFSEWGVRTLAEGESRYNPMSYHNGSVWPHDNALIGLGFARYGLKAPLLRLATGMFGAAVSMPLWRLPELFCGFPRRDGVGPVAYPVACNPQAWSSAAVFALLGAMLGIGFDAGRRQVHFHDPSLPSWLPHLRITNLRVGDTSVDLRVERRGEGVAIDVTRQSGHIDILVKA